MNRVIVVVLISLAIFSCDKNKHKGIYEQGRIEYRITYLNEDHGSFDLALLPKKMVLEFNDKFCTNSIDGFMGFFKLGNITYFSRKKSVTHLKVLDKNYVFTGGRNEPMCCFDIFENMEIEFDTATKIIAGLKSYHAIATIPDTEHKFDIYYTYDINLSHPNVTNPYLEIDGVLTDFVLFMGPYRMRFEAKKFIADKTPKYKGSIPGNAKKVNRKEMVYALERLMEQ